MPRNSKLYFAYPKEYKRNLSEIEVCKLDVDRFDDGCIEKFRTIPIETPRTDFIFSARKVFLFDGTRPTNGMESYDLINSKKDILPNLPMKTVLGPPIIIGKYIYLFGEGSRGPSNATSCFRFDTEQKSWETRGPLPYRMKNVSAVELNGLIYVAGAIEGTTIYTSNFWCYDPNGNIWTEKPHTCIDEGELLLRKVKQSIFICNHFMIYDVSLNRWKKLNHGSLYEDDMFESELHDAVEFRDKLYGVCAIEDALLFQKIDIENNNCSFEDSFQWDYIGNNMYANDTSHFFIH